MNKLLSYVLVLISAVSAYACILCVNKLTEYDAKLVSLNVLLNQQSEISNTLNEEDLIQLRLMDDLKKQIKAQDDRIRIQDAIIAEARARKKK
jgi:hypothetical protein